MIIKKGLEENRLVAITHWFMLLFDIFHSFPCIGKDKIAESLRGNISKQKAEDKEAISQER